MLSHLRVWGCLAYVKHLKTDKLGPKSDRCLFVGYPKETKRYYFYLDAEQKVFVSSRIDLLKKKFLGEGANVCKIKLDEVHEVEGSIHTELDLIGESNSEPIEVPLKRSGRVPYQLDRYYSFLIRDGNPIELDKNDEDPIIYMKAMQRPDSQKWLEAMKFEMESMKMNGVWTLVDPPEGIKSIGCK